MEKIQFKIKIIIFANVTPIILNYGIDLARKITKYNVHLSQRDLTCKTFFHASHRTTLFHLLYFVNNIKLIFRDN
jgi:thiamine monophosphate synthase